MSASKMPRRKKHRNSKLGCATCKRRRIKCSEDLPACSNCVKHRVHCEYLDYSPHQLEVFRAAKFAREHETLTPTEKNETLPQPPSESESPATEAAFDGPGITQAFDTLLATADSEIIYPVYSVERTSNANAHGRGDAGRPLHGATAGAVFRGRRLKLDFEPQFYSVVDSIQPLALSGLALLPQIRHLYHMWIGFFILRAVRDLAMFLCLVNLTTNYMITNVLGAQGEWSAERAGCTDRTERAALVVHLIKHYAQVIAHLRALLNHNTDQSLCASISYILSLMAIYDPEATPHSTKCFRDGLFSVLTHTIRSSPTPVIPTMTILHLQFMKNLSATVYMPPYLPHILLEGERMLARLGELLARITPEDTTDAGTVQLVRRYFRHLEQFTHDAVRVYVPAVDASLDDKLRQEEILFTMMRRWTTGLPLRLLVVRKESDPLEKAVTLFYRLISKCITSVVPQLRFFFLRDLETPLMVDTILVRFEDLLFADLDAPAHLCITPAHYQTLLPELKVLAGYATRTTAFLGMRLALLYRGLVTSPQVQLIAPAANVAEWRDSITDVAAARAEGIARVGLSEVQIESLCNTYIAPAHYPSFGGVTQGLIPASEPVDFMTLQPSGMLARDALPVMKG